MDRPQVLPAEGERRMRVALLPGCAQQVLAPEVNEATIRVLTRHGCEVVVAAGTCIAAKAIRPSIQVIGVQSAEAPAAYRSWKARTLLEDRMGTFAEGLATRTAFELPQRILWKMLDDFVLVPDAEIRLAVKLMIETTRNLTEPAGAAPLAAALRLRAKVRGKRIALVLSGGNITPDQLKESLA